MFKSVGSSAVARGLLALAVGAVALAWPGVTVGAFVIMFAVYAFIDALAQFGLAFISTTAKPVVGHLLLGLAGLVAGALALVWPGATALVLVLLVGSWAIVTGVIEVAAALRSSASAGDRAMFITGGLVSIAFGVVLYARPEVGAVTLAIMFGLYNVLAGTWMLAQGIELRSADRKLRALKERVQTPVAA